MSASRVAAHVEALNLAGLGFAASRLLGKDPQRVSGQFTMWARQELEGLPSLTTPLWLALAPLGSGRPAFEPAAVCDKLLRGRHGDAAAAVQASQQCARAGKEQAAAAPLERRDADDADAWAQQRALVKNVKEYWRALGTIYGEVRSRVVTGEHDRAARMIHKAEVALQPLIQRITKAATGVAGPTAPVTVAAPATPSQVATQPAPESVQPSARPEPRRQPTPLGDRTQSQARAEAFARADRIRSEAEGEADVEPRPVEVLSTKPVRNHIFAPIVFLLVVAAVALMVIFSILNSPNPLAS